MLAVQRPDVDDTDRRAAVLGCIFATSAASASPSLQRRPESVSLGILQRRGKAALGDVGSKSSSS